MNKLFSIPLAAVILPISGFGQAVDDLNAGLQVEHDESTGVNTISWWGIQDHAYFILTSDDLSNWLYINEIFVGGDAIEDGFNFTFTGGVDKAFFKLNYSDHPVEDAFGGDLDGDTISNQSELDNDTDPFLNQDTDINNIPDDADLLWAAVSSSWKQDLLNNPNAFVYDPEGVILSEEDILPIDDYDGDGLSNLQEFLNGTDPADYYNGDAPQIFLIEGSHQKSLQETTAPNTLIVLVVDSGGNALAYAPVIYTVINGGGELTQEYNNESGGQQIVARTNIDGRTFEVFYLQPASTGTSSTITASWGSVSVTFQIETLSNPSSGPPSNVGNLTSTDNSDGSRTLSWDVVTLAHNIAIHTQDSDGVWHQVGVADGSASSYTIPAEVLNNLD